MRELIGISASDGMAVGTLYHFGNETRIAERRTAENAAEEYRRFDEARCKAIVMLETLYRRACAEVGVGESMIFRIHQLLLADQDYLDAVKVLIFDAHYSAEYAVQQAGIQLVRVFAMMDNAYMNARGADLLDISNRIMRLLRGESAINLSAVEGRIILAAHELLPSEMIELDRHKVLAVVTTVGSDVSHSAMLARTLRIPAVVGVGAPLDELENGVTVLVDGSRGVLIASPDAATLSAYETNAFAW